MEENIGYIAIEFDDTSKKKVVEWASQINVRNIVRAIVNGKEECGNVTDKLHLTLFYGLDENALDQDDLNDFITGQNISSVNVVGVSMFPIKEYDCSALYLKVADESGELKSARERLEKFPHLSKYQKFDFKPHITLAYVAKDFDISSLSDDFPRNLSVGAVTHFRKTDPMS
ncbi:MAG: 2'-5' RNA ligase family protein [Minisyncoccota bacterium]